MMDEKEKIFFQVLFFEHGYLTYHFEYIKIILGSSSQHLSRGKRVSKKIDLGPSYIFMV